MTLPTQQARKLSTPQSPAPPAASPARDADAEITGHRLLTQCHPACHCGWCSLHPRKGTCGYRSCLAYPAHPYRGRLQ
jgi:hypothetical protein